MTCGAVFQSRAAPNKGCSKSLAEFRRRSGERKSRLFSSATCAAKKIPLGLQTCAPSAKADGACAAAGRKPFRQKSTTFLTKKTPQTIACGVASAYPRSIASEAGLAPSGSPAAPAHNLAAADVPETATTPAGRVCRAAAACSKTSQSFAAAAAKESLDHFLRRHVRRRKYRSACKRAHRPPRRTARALQQAANPFVKKVLLF